MTDALTPLFLLWMLSSGSSSSSRTSSRSSAPLWPDTRSPPPPLPAFVPYVPDPQHGTPLTTLHNEPTKPTPPQVLRRGTPIDALQQGAKAATKTGRTLRKAGSKAIKAARQTLHFSSSPFASLIPSSRGPVEVSKPVSEIQAIVNTRGGTLKRDGLYGPKTAGAWSALAKQHGLPADISRGGPRIARVALHTFEVLSVPPIP